MNFRRLMLVCMVLLVAMVLLERGEGFGRVRLGVDTFN